MYCNRVRIPAHTTTMTTRGGRRRLEDVLVDAHAEGRRLDLLAGALVPDLEGQRLVQLVQGHVAQGDLVAVRDVARAIALELDLRQVAATLHEDLPDDDRLRLLLVVGVGVGGTGTGTGRHGDNVDPHGRIRAGHVAERQDHVLADGFGVEFDAAGVALLVVVGRRWHGRGGRRRRRRRTVHRELLDALADRQRRLAPGQRRRAGQDAGRRRRVVPAVRGAQRELHGGDGHARGARPPGLHVRPRRDVVPDPHQLLAVGAAQVAGRQRDAGGGGTGAGPPAPARRLRRGRPRQAVALDRAVQVLCVARDGDGDAVPPVQGAGLAGDAGAPAVAGRQARVGRQDRPGHVVRVRVLHAAERHADAGQRRHRPVPARVRPRQRLVRARRHVPLGERVADARQPVRHLQADGAVRPGRHVDRRVLDVAVDGRAGAGGRWRTGAGAGAGTGRAQVRAGVLLRVPAGRVGAGLTSREGPAHAGQLAGGLGRQARAGVRVVQRPAPPDAVDVGDDGPVERVERRRVHLGAPAAHRGQRRLEQVLQQDGQQAKVELGERHALEVGQRLGRERGVRAPVGDVQRVRLEQAGAVLSRALRVQERGRDGRRRKVPVVDGRLQGVLQAVQGLAVPRQERRRPVRRRRVAADLAQRPALQHRREVGAVRGQGRRRQRRHRLAPPGERRVSRGGAQQQQQQGAQHSNDGWALHVSVCVCRCVGWCGAATQSTTNRVRVIFVLGSAATCAAGCPWPTPGRDVTGEESRCRPVMSRPALGCWPHVVRLRRNTCHRYPGVPTTG